MDVRKRLTTGPPSGSRKMPRLSQFIAAHADEITAAWAAFATSLPSTGQMDITALRDHAKGMLDVISADLETPQTEQQRDRKSRGFADRVDRPTQASKHGHGRAERGFSVESTVAEFRALRASVLSLWVAQQREAGPSELEEMRRFNEAIDQAIAESLAQYTKDINAARERLLAVLGHDLRTPISAILMSSRVLLDEGGLRETQLELLTVIERGARRMTYLIDDLLDLSLTGFGDAMPVHRASTDLGELAHEVVNEVNTTSPKTRIHVKTSGSLIGDWDRKRLGEALTNLLSNAIAHGTPGKPISVAASGDGDGSVMLAVTNQGLAIPRDQISGLFSAMKRTAADRADRRHLGLGLYVVNRIVEAHGGTMDVRSSDEHGTTFRMTLPRHAAPDPAKS
jgi:signal transduction histidine kinase